MKKEKREKLTKIMVYIIITLFVFSLLPIAFR